MPNGKTRSNLARFFNKAYPLTILRSIQNSCPSAKLVQYHDMRWESFTLSGHLHRQKSHPITLIRILWLAIAMAVDIVLCFVITICTYYFIAWKIFTPTERGFYCNDESIKKPLFENTVPTSWLLAITLAFPFFTVVLANFLSKTWDDIREKMVQVIQLSTYVYLDYVVGFWVTTLILDIIKCLVGRLRPNFIAMCMPDKSYLSTCQTNSTAFITGIVCTNENWRKARNARMSFPSGHAAAALFSLLFVHYFLTQLHHASVAKYFKIFRTLVTTFFVAFCVYCCISRVTDFWHFPTDVLGGCIIAFIIFQFSLNKYKVIIKDM